jgi:uncharacterized membrane protein
MSKTTTWLIKRNCSASPRQLAVVLLSLIGISFTFGAGFAIFGLWMVLPFVGLELIAVAIAFVCYGRHATDFERIVLSDGHLNVERIEGGQCIAVRFESPWTRVELRERGLAPGARVLVEVVSGGRRVEVGRHLLDEKRRVLARELRTALASAAAVA